MPDPGAPVDLLWTGGWDSTFRLLQLVVSEGRTVRPHYVFNDERRGAVEETRAMRRVAETLARSHPEAAPRVLPTRVAFRHDVDGEGGAADARERLLGETYLGTQYVWLAAYAEAAGVEALEMSVHLDDKAEHYLRPHVVARPGGGYELSPSAPADVRALYGRFVFPLLDLSKPEMRRVARAEGFEGAMRHTWFCHEPIRGEPCGRCAPCQYTIEEGLGDRLPRAAHLRSRTLPLYTAVTGAIGKARFAGGRELRRLGLRRDREPS